MSNEHMKTSLRITVRNTVDRGRPSRFLWHPQFLTVPLSISVNVNSTPTEARLKPSEVSPNPNPSPHPEAVRWNPTA